MPIGVVPGLVPRGLLYCWPFADAGFTELIQGLQPAAKGATLDFGSCRLGSGLKTPLDNTSFVGYNIAWPSLSTPFSLEGVVWLNNVLATVNTQDIANLADSPNNTTSVTSGFGITSAATTKWQAQANSNTTTFGTLTNNATVAVVGYNHVVATWDGATLSIWTQGIFRNSNPIAAPLTQVNSTKCIIIGSETNTGNVSINNGRYLLVNLATVVWSKSEIMARFANPFGFLLYQEDMIVGTTYSLPSLALLANSGGLLFGRGAPVFPGRMQLLSAAQDTGKPNANFSTALAARSGAQSKEIVVPSYLKALLGLSASQAKARASVLYVGILAGLSAAQSKGSAATRATTSLVARTTAQGKILPNLGAVAIITAVSARAAMISTGRALGAFTGPIFGRAAAAGKSLPGLSAASSISSRSMAQGKATPSLRGLSSLVSQVALMSKGRASAAYSSALSARAVAVSQAQAAMSAATSLLARSTAQAKAFGTVNFGIVALLTRAAAVNMGRALTAAKSQLTATSNAQAKSRGLLLGVTALLARSTAQGKALGASVGLSSLITRVAAIGMGRAATSAKAQLAAISNSQGTARGLLSAVTSLLARGAAQGKALGTINFGIISLISRSLAKNAGRVMVTYTARLSTTATSVSKANGLLSATTALLARSAAQSRALPSLILTKALTALGAAQSKGRIAVTYTAQLRNVTATRLKASGTIRFAGQTASFASSAAVSFGRAALALLPPIVDPARLLVSAGKTRLLLAFGEARSRLLTSSGKTRLLLAYGEGRNRLISTLGKLRLLKR